MANIETRISRLEMSGEGGARIIVVSDDGVGSDALLAVSGVVPRPHDLVITLAKPEGCGSWVSVDGERIGTHAA
jgi:hypothetical protein